MEDLSTQDRGYAERLQKLESVWWKKLLDVQAPYRWNLRRLKPGKTLEIGCGIGRNLAALSSDSVGVDHNSHSVEIALKRGFKAFTSHEFKQSRFGTEGSFDSLLLSHLVEHMGLEENVSLLREYIPYLKPKGRILIIAPQERGYRSDPTHVEFMDFEKIAQIVESVGFKVVRSYSFPFPRSLGRFFVYNEFIAASERT